MIRDLVGVICDQATKCARAKSNISIRLYGGWRWESGQHSPKYSAVLRVLGRFRGIFKGHQVVPKIVDGLLYPKYTPLCGTVRRKIGSRINEQKIVDTHIGCDLIRETSFVDFSHLFLCTDDDDLLPCLLHAMNMQKYAKDYSWIRHRAFGAALNDRNFPSLSKIISTTGLRP